MNESVAIIRWIYREFIVAESRRWTRRMLIALAISVTALNGIAWLAKYLVDGLIRHDAHSVKMSFLGMAVCVLIYGYFDRILRQPGDAVQRRNRDGEREDRKST